MTEESESRGMKRGASETDWVGMDGSVRDCDCGGWSGRE